MQVLTIQTHVGGTWHTAATVEMKEPERGIHGASKTTYEDDYLFEVAAEELNDGAIDRRALSVRCPVSLEDLPLKTWPAWLLDLMPQGVARARIAEKVKLRRDDPRLDVHLLMYAGGTPIGNLRIKEAWEAEQERLKGVDCPPLTDDDLAVRSERFIDVVERFAHLASGSSGIQGEWPKALMTRSAKDGCWYPDPFVPTDEGAEHVIVKLLKSTSASDRLILESEAPYLEVARAFGLKVGASLTYHENVLIIPRFDRTVINGAVALHGQESLVSAKGVAEFGHNARHEDYLAVIREVSDDPAADTLEYVLRDFMNFAMGNPDNHGRNSALTKPSEGGVRLSPLFDFPPMRLSDAAIGRQTRWTCLEGGDLEGGWAQVCEAAASDDLPATTIRQTLLDRLPMVQELNTIARDLGVPDETIDRAFNVDRAIRSLEALEAQTCPARHP